MMRNRPWKLFSGNASAPLPDLGTKTLAEATGGSIASPVPDAERLSSSLARGVGAIWADLAEPIMVVDLDGGLIEANPPALKLGERFGSLLRQGSPIAPLLTRARVATPSGAPAWAPAAGGDDPSVAALGSPAEEVFELRSTLRRDAEGRPKDWLVRLVDITELVAAQHERHEAIEHRDRLLKLLSHDMRTPLAAILATLKHPGLATAPEHLRAVIESAAHRALSMVDSNVRLIRAQSSDYRFVELEFSHIIEEAIDASWALAKDAGVRIVLEPTTLPSPILADRGYLTEAFNELFAHLIDQGVSNPTLLCSLSPDVLHGAPAITLDIRGVDAGRAATERPETSDPSNDAFRGQINPFEEGVGLQLLKAVVIRHRGAVGCERGTDAVRGLFVTIPSVEVAPDSF